MRGKSIAFIIEKGGTGKSTICFNVGWEMSKTSRVLLVDLDAQMANLTYFCGISKDDILTVGDILDDSTTLENAAVKVKENLDIIPADNTIMEIGTQEHFNRLHKIIHFKSGSDYQLYLIDKMQKLIKNACKTYDYVLLDPNPSPNYLHTLALCASRFIVIPVLPDAASIVSDEGTADSLEIIREEGINEEVKVLGILFNRYTPRTNLSRQVKAILDEYAKDMSTSVFVSTVRNSVVLSECVGMHTGITDYRPNSAAAEDTRQVVTEIKRRIEHGN